jgi:hypothetical protein
MITWRKRITSRVPKTTNTHSEYVILTAFPLQQWLHERASMLRYTYIACLVLVLCIKPHSLTNDSSLNSYYLFIHTSLLVTIYITFISQTPSLMLPFHIVCHVKEFQSEHLATFDHPPFLASKVENE